MYLAGGPNPISIVQNEKRNSPLKHNIAFLFPGQGAQQVGMGHDLHSVCPQARELFAHADSELGFPLSRLCFEGPEEELNQDLNSQLAVYTLSCIITEILKKQDIKAQMVSGYSSGFYAAAYAAGCFSFTEGLNVVKRAGEILIHEGGKIDGSMAVVFGLPLEKVKSICQKTGNVEVAIVNTPSQIVISGLTPYVKEAMSFSRAVGALDAHFLPSAVAYHSRFMKQSTSRFLEEINGNHLRKPEIPLVSYLSLEPVSSSEQLREIMALQLCHPVSWVDLIKSFRNSNIELFIEVGPGQIISRSVRWIDRGIEILTTSNKQNLLETIRKYRMPT